MTQRQSCVLACASYKGVQARVIRGKEAICEQQVMLARMCDASGQFGEADNLRHFLTTATALRKIPCLVVIEKQELHGTTSNPDRCLGAVLVFEYAFGPFGSRIFASSDWTGRRNVLARVELRPSIAALAGNELLARGAQVVLIGYHSTEDLGHAAGDVAAAFRQKGDLNGSWTMLPRPYPLFLPLLDTFDNTLSQMGKKTRRNLRVYRRRAEADLGCIFIPQLSLTLEELRDFNRQCSFVVSDKVLRSRYDGMGSLKYPFLSGLSASDGRLLSLVAGWKRHNTMEIEWQMNRADLPGYSLSTVMRSYLLEHAIAQGFERLYMEGGTPHSIQSAFQCEVATELIAVRSTLHARFLTKIAQRVFPRDNHIVELLRNPDLEWRPISSLSQPEPMNLRRLSLDNETRSLK